MAQILINLDKSFKAFVRSQGGRSIKPELSVSAVRAGSIEILLDAIDGLGKLYLARQYLGPFATHIAQLVQLAVGMQLYKRDKLIADHDRKAIKFLAAPVANGHARQVNIVNNANIVLNINSVETAKTIIESLSAPQMSNDSVQIQPVRRLDITQQQIVELEHGKLMGSALLVDGIWYARLAGGQGVLVPISASDETKIGLEHGKQYAFSGHTIPGSKGEIIGIALDSATENGGR